MALYDRLMGLEPRRPLLMEWEMLATPQIPVNYFCAAMAEFARGRITGAQAQAIINAASWAPLSGPEITEANTLLATVTGTATAKLARAKEIEDVLILAERLFVPYNTPALVKTRLGV